MADANNKVRVYMAIKSPRDRSHFEDQLVLDGLEASMFINAEELWSVFRLRPTRMVITDRRFSEGLNGLALVGNIREHFLLPYCYTIMLSELHSMAEIQEGLDAGVDDYLAKPLNPLQLRTRILVGLRWLTYIDSLQNAGKESMQAA